MIYRTNDAINEMSEKTGKLIPEIDERRKKIITTITTVEDALTRTRFED